MRVLKISSLRAGISVPRSPYGPLRTTAWPFNFSCAARSIFQGLAISLLSGRQPSPQPLPSK